MISGDGLFKYRTVRRVIREEDSNQKWIDEAVTPIDENVQKGAKSSFEDVRTHRLVVEGHAPIPAALGRAFFFPEGPCYPRRTLMTAGTLRNAEVANSCRPALAHARTTATSTE